MHLRGVWPKKDECFMSSVVSSCLVIELFLLCMYNTSVDGHGCSHVRTSTHMIRAPMWHIRQFLRQSAICGKITSLASVCSFQIFPGFFSLLIKAHLRPGCPIYHLRCVGSCHLATEESLCRVHGSTNQLLSDQELLHAGGRAKPGPSMHLQSQPDVLMQRCGAAYELSVTVSSLWITGLT